MKFALLFALCATGCLAAPEERSIINDRIRALIESVRVQMPEGWPDRDIPPLAPLLIEHLDTNLDSESLVAVGYIQNVRVDGLNEFDVVTIQFSLVGLRLTFKIVVPEIYATGFYDLNGRIMNSFPVRGRGDFRAKIRDIVVDGHTRLAVRDGFLYMREFVPTIRIGSVVSEFDGLVSDQPLTSDFINRVIEILIPDLFNLYEDFISETVAGVVIPIADSVLNNMTISDLLTGESQFNDRVPQIELY